MRADMGYYVPYGYKGKVNGRWMLFESEVAYLEYINKTKHN